MSKVQVQPLSVDDERDRRMAAEFEGDTHTLRLFAIIDAVRAERDALRVIVAKLPTTADGTRVVPGRDFVYHPKHGLLQCQEGGFSRDFCGLSSVRTSECYSTLELATAAAKAS